MLYVWHDEWSHTQNFIKSENDFFPYFFENKTIDLSDGHLKHKNNI